MQGNMGVIRDLGLADNLDTTVTTWASRSLASYWSWVAPEMRDGIYAGSHGGNPKQAPPLKINFTGRISGSTLTATGVTAGALAPGQYLDGAHIEGTIDNGIGGAGNILTVTSTVDGTVAIGETLYDVQGVIADRTTIIGSVANSAVCGGSPCTGNGGNGTYLLSGGSQHVTPARLYGSHTGTDIINLTIPGVAANTLIAGDPRYRHLRVVATTKPSWAGSYVANRQPFLFEYGQCASVGQRNDHPQMAHLDW